MQEAQNFKNHARFFPLFHFVLMPILLFHLIWCIVRTVQDFSWDRLEYLLIAFVLVLITLSARMQALAAQDRVIKLEERLRYKSLLNSVLEAKASQFKIGQMIALRFASDEELPSLVEKIISSELKTSKEIKMAVKNWRGDYLRV
jgi:Family of unknown function (DUF6526)